jgi:4-amino-4-deoxy-L-arabinose transferase-like glycosyltransferase
MSISPTNTSCAIPSCDPRQRAGDGAEHADHRRRLTDRACALILLLSCWLLFFAWLGSSGFIDPGDGYFSEASREMIEYNDYITPHLNYQVYFSKPILIYWLIISAYKVFGVSEFAARFWSAALATAMVSAAFWTIRCLAGRRAGLLAGLILASSPLVVTFARMSLTDMAFSSFLSIAVCALVMTLVVGSNRWWPVIYAALGLAALTKGPAALALCGLAMAAYFLLHRFRLPFVLLTLKRLRLGWGAVIFAAIAVPWYVAVGLATNGLWPQVFFVFENFQRFTGMTNHKHPDWWFYLPVVLYGFFPWALLLPSAIGNCLGIPKSSAPLTPEKEQKREGSRILVCWMAALVLFFSMSLTKQQAYLLPAILPMAMLVAMLFDDFVRKAATAGPVPRSLRLFSLTLLPIGLLAAVSALVSTVVLINPQLAAAANANTSYLSAFQDIVTGTPVWARTLSLSALLFLAIGFVTQYVCLKGGRAGAAIVWIVATTVSACSFAAPVAFEIGYQLKQADLNAVVASLAGRSGPVALFQEFKPTVVYQLQRPVDTFFLTDQVYPATYIPGTRQYIIAGKEGAQELVSAFGGKLELLAQKGAWCAFQTSELRVQRLPNLEQTFSQHVNLNTERFRWGMLPFSGGAKPSAKI